MNTFYLLKLIHFFFIINLYLLKFLKITYYTIIFLFILLTSKQYVSLSNLHRKNNNFKIKNFQLKFVLLKLMLLINPNDNI